jgi:Cu(I)/Ag(I) efflux system membrane fusion protein
MTIKSLKYVFWIVLILACSVGGYYLLKPHLKTHFSNELYTCSMHPQIIRKQPGKCPICGMDLVIKNQKNSDETNENLDVVLKPTNEYVVGHFHTTKLKDTTVFEEVVFPGEVKYDETKSFVVAAKVGGRIEKMIVKYPLQKVMKGQKLFEIYSLELLTMQDNYLYLLSNDVQNKELLLSAKNKLMLYGMSSQQVHHLEKSKIANPIIAVYSDFEGVVTDIKLNNKMNQLFFHEGSYVKIGQPVFKIVDTENVWGVFHILQGYSDLVKMGQSIFISNEVDSKSITTEKIDFIEIELNKGDKTNTFRVNLKNSKIPIGTRLEGSIYTKETKGTFLKKTAFITLGTERVVFVEVNGVFKSKVVQTGVETSDYIQVLDGLSKSEQVVENAAYLLDSESFIKIKN